MSIEITVPRKGFCQMLEDLFGDVGIKEEEYPDGYPNLVPLTTNHVTINGVTHYFEDDVKHYLSYNEYGQLSIEFEDSKKLPEYRSQPSTRLHISWNVKNLTELWITAPSKYNGINPKTNDLYYELFVFKLR